MDSDEIKNLNKLLESIYLQIKMLEDDLCANRLTMSDDEFNNKLKELEILKNVVSSNVYAEKLVLKQYRSCGLRKH